ncbi:MAG: hypothetical protein ACOC1F_10550 [Myxococcota bacterium]
MPFRGERLAAGVVLIMGIAGLGCSSPERPVPLYMGPPIPIDSSDGGAEAGDGGRDGQTDADGEAAAG